MIIKLFTKPDCPKCPAAKKVTDELRLTNHGLQVEDYDTATIDGMAEAAFYTVMATPTILLCDSKGKEITGWRGLTPSLEELTAKIK